jgi:hypothetical protein
MQTRICFIEEHFSFGKELAKVFANTVGPENVSIIGVYDPIETLSRDCFPDKFNERLKLTLEVEDVLDAYTSGWQRNYIQKKLNQAKDKKYVIVYGCDLTLASSLREELNFTTVHLSLSEEDARKIYFKENPGIEMDLFKSFYPRIGDEPKHEKTISYKSNMLTPLGSLLLLIDQS